MKKKSFWDTEVGKKTWIALVTGQISQSEASRIPGAPGQSAISQKLLRRDRQKFVADTHEEVVKDDNYRKDHHPCPVCGMISEFEELTEAEKIRFRRLLSTSRDKER